MNDSKRVQTHTLEEKAQYHALRHRWAELVHSDLRHELKAQHFLLYAALLNRDWRRGFSPVRRASKLANGFPPYGAALSALYAVYSLYLEPALIEPFGDLVTVEMVKALRARLPKPTS